MAGYSRFMSTSTLSGDRVFNMQQEDLGKIDDFMLDTVNGCISYAVLSFGGILGMGNKLFAVPWKALSLDEANHRFLMDMPREHLEQMPGFDKNNWPDMASSEFETSMKGFWGPFYRTEGESRSTPSMHDSEYRSGSFEGSISFKKTRMPPMGHEGESREYHETHCPPA